MFMQADFSCHKNDMFKKVGGVGLGWGEAKAHLILDNTRKMHPSNLGGLLRGAFSLENARIFRGWWRGCILIRNRHGV